MFNVECLMFKDMKTRLYIIALLSVMSVALYAQVYSSEPNFDPAIKSQQMINGGATYHGVVYEPFSNTAPSEYNTEAVAAQKPSVRGGFDGGAESGQGPSPIGDAVLPLLLCAAVFGGVVLLRRRRVANNG
jgi:hypothetical protein